LERVNVQERVKGPTQMHRIASRLPAVIGWATISLLFFGTGITGA